MKKLTIWERITSESPKLFKTIVNVSMTFAGVATAVLTAPNVIPDFILPEDISTLCKYSIVAGIAAAAVGKTTVK